MKIYLHIFIICILFSCNEKENSQNNKKAITENNKLTKREYYQSKMNTKNFSMTQNGPCNDALEDTLHERYIAYIESKNISDSKTIIEFKFKDACCQEFLGDYLVINDTLKFKFEQVNEEMCSCICWYRYKLELNNINERFSEIEIIDKKMITFANKS